MLNGISVQNYKAFEKATIPLKPITVLVGANSVGKSSIIQLLLMLQQTGRAGLKSYKSALKLYGGYVNLGDSVNLFRNRDTDKPLTIQFEIKSKSLKDFLRIGLLESYTKIFTDLPMYLPLKGLAEVRGKPVETLEQFNGYLDGIISILSKGQTKESFVKEIKWFLGNRYDIFIPELNTKSKDGFLEAFELLTIISKAIKNETFKMGFEVIYKNNALHTQSIEISHADKIILKLIVTDDGRHTITSDLVPFKENELEHLNSLFNPSNTIFNSFTFSREKLQEYEKHLSVKLSIAVKILSFFQDGIKKEFSEDIINYVSPLRAHPKRYYMLDKAKLNLTLDTLDGDAIAEVLKDNPGIKSKVNAWLNKFGIQVNVEEFKEVIHHLKVKQNNLSLDITDVGFGISQVLPVIIQGFLSADDSYTIIEQPEIHLHPKIQADLGDLFIDIVKNSSGKKLLIETHSEYLLRRLRRRISEGKINPNQISICIVDAQSNGQGAIVRDLEILNKGYFDWPQDFLDDKLIDDTTEFLKNQ